MTASAPATNKLRRYRSPCLLMPPSLFLPPLECCFGTSPIQAEKSRPDRKAFGSATLATSAVASAGPTPGSSSSRWLTWLDRCQAMIRRSEFQYPRLEHRQLGAKRRNTGTRDIGQPVVVAIPGNIEQLFNTSAPDRGDNAELGKVSSDRIDDGRLLPDEQMACAMEHQAALLLGSLRRDEPHVCSRDRFADCLRVGRI